MNIDPCKICRQPNRRRLIEADWADGKSAAAISKIMEDAGWPIGAPTILRHLKEHAGPEAAVRKPPNLRPKDWGAHLQSMIGDEVERRLNRARELAEEATEACAAGLHNPETEGIWRCKTARTHDPGEFFDVLAKDLQPALGTILKAEANAIKKEQTGQKRPVGLIYLMLGGEDGRRMLAPKSLVGEIDEKPGDEDEMVLEGEFVDVDAEEA